MELARLIPAIGFSVSCLVSWPTVAATITVNATPVAGQQSELFTRFDPNLGYLDDVVFAYTFSAAFQTTIVNTIFVGGNGQVNVNNVYAELLIYGGGVGSVTLQGESAYTIAAATPLTYGPRFESPAYAYPLVQLNAVSGTSTVFQRDLSSRLPFIIGTGLENFSYSFNTYTPGYSDVTVNGPGGLQGYYIDGNAPSVTISYDYTPTTTVPEPASLLILSAGLLGMVGALRTRRVVALEP